MFYHSVVYYPPAAADLFRPFRRFSENSETLTFWFSFEKHGDFDLFLRPTTFEVGTALDLQKMIPSRMIPRLVLARTPTTLKATTPSLPFSPSRVSPFSTSPSSSSSSSNKPSINPKDHLTANEAESKRIEESNTSPPGALSRPLGVKDPPSTLPKSREQWRADLLSQTRRLTERKHL